MPLITKRCTQRRLRPEGSRMRKSAPPFRGVRALDGPVPHRRRGDRAGPVALDRLDGHLADLRREVDQVVDDGALILERRRLGRRRHAPGTSLSVATGPLHEWLPVSLLGRRSYHLNTRLSRFRCPSLTPGAGDRLLERRRTKLLWHHVSGRPCTADPDAATLSPRTGHVASDSRAGSAPSSTLPHTRRGPRSKWVRSGADAG